MAIAYKFACSALGLCWSDISCNVRYLRHLVLYMVVHQRHLGRVSYSPHFLQTFNHSSGFLGVTWRSAIDLSNVAIFRWRPITKIWIFADLPITWALFILLSRFHRHQSNRNLEDKCFEVPPLTVTSGSLVTIFVFRLFCSPRWKQ